MNRFLLLLPIVVIFCLSTLDINAQYYDLTKSLPSNYSTIGNVDYTKYIQKGINQHKKVKMPNFPILINTDGLRSISDSEIFFQKNSKLVMIPNDKEFYSVIKVINCKNVIIKNSHIIGDKNIHLGTKGEWGMGILIQGSYNIKITNANIVDCWGDGIYIGGDEETKNEYINIENSKISNCRRNGISITHGSNINIKNLYIANIKGTPPMAGIDIEPNNTKASIDKILLENITTKDNENFGLLIVLGQLMDSISRKVEINIDKHTDYNSKVAFSLVGFWQDDSKKKSLTGLIQVNDSRWFDNKTPLSVRSYDFGPRVKFNRTQIYETQIKSRNNKKTKVSVVSSVKLQRMKQTHKTYTNIIID